jgi:hypothetical protein
VVLNPVKAGMVTSSEQWRWSSYHATAGQAYAPDWLATEWVLRQFGTRRTRDAVYRFCSSWCPSCDRLCVALMRVVGRLGTAASAREDWRSHERTPRDRLPWIAWSTGVYALHPITSEGPSTTTANPG